MRIEPIAMLLVDWTCQLCKVLEIDTVEFLKVDAWWGCFCGRSCLWRCCHWRAIDQEPSSVGNISLEEPDPAGMVEDVPCGFLLQVYESDMSEQMRLKDVVPERRDLGARDEVGGGEVVAD